MAIKQIIPDFVTFVNEMYEAEGMATSQCCGAEINEDGTCSACGEMVVSENEETVNDVESGETDLPQVEDQFDKDPGDAENMDPEVAANVVMEGRKKKPFIGPTFKELNKGKGKKQPAAAGPSKYSGIAKKKVFKKDFGKMAEPEGPRVKDKDKAKEPNAK